MNIRRFLLLFAIIISNTIMAEKTDTICKDSIGKTIHRISIDISPSLIIHTNDYLKGRNTEGRTMNHAIAYDLSYSFEAAPGSLQSSIYADAYQGIGIVHHEFNKELGNPNTFYIFQGAPIARISSRLTFNYEWNLGLTFGWHPYNSDTNPDNKVIGSKVTAYIYANLYLRLLLNKDIDFMAGVSLTHFSNGNTKYPNSGLNVFGVRMGLAYYINRDQNIKKRSEYIASKFKKHISYDLVFFGAWKRRGIALDDGLYALPNAYGVFGFNFNPMYNFNPWFKTGASLDYIYDSSANLYLEDYVIPYGSNSSDESEFDHIRKPSAFKQMALGLSYRLEFVMPYFSINIGLGSNILNNKGDLSGIYQTIALKMGVTRNLFLHIGYNLRKFKNPNSLMLGIGYRFNNKRHSM